MSLMRKVCTVGWNVALGSFGQLFLLIEIVKSGSLLKSKFRKCKEQLGEQCGNTVVSTKTPSCTLLNHSWGFCTIMGSSIPDTERNRNAVFFLWWSLSTFSLQQKCILSDQVHKSIDEIYLSYRIEVF